MMHDKLQLHLEEMELNNPSLNLKNKVPSLKEKIHFFRRSFFQIEQIPQETSSYGSLDDQLRDYKKLVNYEDFTDMEKERVIKSFELARKGELWNSIKSEFTYIDYDLEDKPLCHISITPSLEKKLKKLYSEGIKLEGPNNLKEYIDSAFYEAEQGELWNSIESTIKWAKKYANEAKIPFKLNMADLKNKYDNNSYARHRKAMDCITWAGIHFQAGRCVDGERYLSSAKRYDEEAYNKMPKK